MCDTTLLDHGWSAKSSLFEVLWYIRKEGAKGGLGQLPVASRALRHRAIKVWEWIRLGVK